MNEMMKNPMRNFDFPEYIEVPPMPPVAVKVYSESKHGLPKYETEDSSGMDLKSNMPAFKLYPGETKIVKTGLFVEMNGPLEFQVRPRSGMSSKTKLRIANSPGTIDVSYRGEIGVIVENIGDDPIDINDGDRIAQLVLVPILHCKWLQVENQTDLSSTDRGTGGFGSTGTK